MTNAELLKTLTDIASEFDRHARAELEARWASWKLDLENEEIHAVVGALVARQVTLAIQLARSPAIWTHDLAPVILRAMADVYVNLAWIFIDPAERARKFIWYGLGQMKLEIEHRKAQLKAEGKDVERDPLVEASESWINSQRWVFLTEVNLGSWSETNSRKMAEEASCIAFYNYVYTPFSAATHSAWHHVSRFNLKECLSPLHRYHQVPLVPAMKIDPYYLFLAGKYLDKAFRLFDEKTAVTIEGPSSFQRLEDSFARLRGDQDSEPASTSADEIV